MTTIFKYEYSLPYFREDSLNHFLKKYGFTFQRISISNTMNNTDASIIIQKYLRSYLDRKKTVILLLNRLDWSNLIKIYTIFGESLNSNDMKFMKGKLYEIFVATSNSHFIHVDKIGFDIVCFGIKIELKFSQNMLLTNGRELKKTITFRCKNSNGSQIMNISMSNTASIYALVQRDAIGWVEGYIVKKHLSGSGDLDAKIPKDKIQMLWKKQERIDIINLPQFDLSTMITRIYKCICTSIWNGEDWKDGLKCCLHQIADDL